MPIECTADVGVEVKMVVMVGQVGEEFLCKSKAFSKQPLLVSKQIQRTVVLLGKPCVCTLARH